MILAGSPNSPRGAGGAPLTWQGRESLHKIPTKAPNRLYGVGRKSKGPSKGCGGGGNPELRALAGTHLRVGDGLTGGSEWHPV